MIRAAFLCILLSEALADRAGIGFRVKFFRWSDAKFNASEHCTFQYMKASFEMLDSTGGGVLNNETVKAMFRQEREYYFCHYNHTTEGNLYYFSTESMAECNASMTQADPAKHSTGGRLWAFTPDIGCAQFGSDIALQFDTIMSSATTSFTLGGTVADFDAAAQKSIKSAFAKGAGVGADKVEITVTAGSVNVATEIYFATDQAAASAMSSLNNGILKDASSLQTALTTQFAADGLPTTNLQVSALDPLVGGPGGGSGAAGLSTGALIGIIVGAVVGVAILGAVIYKCFCKTKGTPKNTEKTGRV